MSHLQVLEVVKRLLRVLKTTTIDMAWAIRQVEAINPDRLMVLHLILEVLRLLSHPQVLMHHSRTTTGLISLVLQIPHLINNQKICHRLDRSHLDGIQILQKTSNLIRNMVRIARKCIIGQIIVNSGRLSIAVPVVLNLSSGKVLVQVVNGTDIRHRINLIHKVHQVNNNGTLWLHKFQDNLLP